MHDSSPGNETPSQSGYAMPAEWERHARTWMCWPCRTEAWGSIQQMEHARAATAEVARAIAGFEPVTMIARPADADSAEQACGGAAEIFVTPIDDSWARDCGPTFLSGKAVAGVAWRFNAWGEKYHSYDNDAALGGRILQRAAAKEFSAPIVCEGGAIHVDGESSLITTEQCLLSPNRNPGRARDEIADALRDYTGAEAVLWLPGEFADVETDGHVDNIACFVAPGRVLLGIPPAAHPDFRAAAQLKRFLSEARDARGRAFEIVEIAQPQRAREDWRGRPLAASYVNFYLTNGGLVMPAFDDPADLPASRVLKDCFPARDVVQIDARDLVQGGGGIHCITQQEPA
jgi:agmatine deiminase